jgi:hypothetical protein
MKNNNSKKESSISSSQISSNSQSNKKEKVNTSYSQSLNDSMKLDANIKNLSATYSNIPKKTEHKENISIIWIDQKNSVNNKKYEKIFSIIEYAPNSFKEFNNKFCDKVSDGINTIKEIYFKYCYIIVSGKYFHEFTRVLKEEINNLRCIPIIMIFTSKEYEKVLIEKLPDKYTDPEVYDLINHPFFNLGGVFHKSTFMLEYIKNFEKSIENKKEYQKAENLDTYKGCYIFQRIVDPKNLILPSLYSQLNSENNKISQNDIKTFLGFLKEKHYKQNIDDLVLPLSQLSQVPFELLSKIFIRIYTSDSYFYYEMNIYLMKNKQDLYSTFIKMLYKGLYLNSIQSNYDDCLYRGALISKKEFNNLQENLKNKKAGLPSSILYSRAFLSFSKKIDQIKKKFLREPNKTDGLITVIFQINKNQNLNKIVHPSNADLSINELSFYSKEEEVVFFPFSSFCIENISEPVIEERNPTKKEAEKNNSSAPIKTEVIYIYLEYLGKYEHVVKEELKTTEIKDIISNIKEDKFYNDVVNARNPVDEDVASEATNISSIDLNDLDLVSSLENIMEFNKTIIFNDVNEEIQENEISEHKYSNILVLNENCFCYSKKNEILVNKNDQTLIMTIKDDVEPDRINYLLKNKNGKILACCFNHTIKVIKIDFINNSYFIEQRLKEHNLMITKLIELNDNRICSCSYDGTIKLWRLNEINLYDKEKNLFTKEKTIFYSILEINNHFAVVLKDSNKNIWIYIIQENRLKTSENNIMIKNNNIITNRDNLLKVDDNEGKFLVGGNKKIYLYNIKGENIKEININIDVCTSLKLKNGEYIFGGEKGQIVGLQQLDDKDYMFNNTEKHSREIISLAETYNGNFISRGFDKILVINLNAVA